MANSELLQILQPFVDGGMESRKVDLKYLLDLSKQANRIEFAKDVIAMANTPGGRGYLVIGVRDEKDRKTNDPTDYIPGWRPGSARVFEQQMTQALCSRFGCPPGLYTWGEGKLSPGSANGAESRFRCI